MWTIYGPRIYLLPSCNEIIVGEGRTHYLP